MSEFNIESESIDVERIMAQIRDRLRDKRGEDYTEEQIRELATTKLERFLDPKNVRSGMVEFYQKQLKEKRAALNETAGANLRWNDSEAPEAPPSFEFDPDVIYRSSRGFGGQVLYRIRKMLNPLLKFFFNPVPIVHALTVQQQINERQAKVIEVINQMVRTQAEFIEIAALNHEVMNNLVVEMTRLSIEMKNHRMRVESVAGRLDFDERRARSLEKVVQYREGSAAPATADGDSTSDSKRRRRRRGRRRPSGAPPPANEEASSPRPAGEVSTAPRNGPDSASAESPARTEPGPGRPAVAASPPAESLSSPAPSDSSAGESSRPQDRADATPPAASPSPGASAPPADNTGSVSNDPAASADETDPSER